MELCNEIYFTTKIEGAKTTYERTVEIHNGKKINNNDFSESMVKNGFDAIKFLNVHGNKLDEDILIQVWNIIVNNACENEDIRGTKYRTGNVQVGTHVGIMPQFLEEYMSYWIEFYNSSEMDDIPFIKAALLHYVFESIHPFCDGNGRTGRLLMINYLISRGYDKLKAVSFSKEIARTINGYYNAFQLSDNSYFDCTPFILYMLRVFDRSIISSLGTDKSSESNSGYDSMLEIVRSIFK